MEFNAKINGKQLFRIVLGTAMQPFFNGQDANEQFDTAFACGITAIDTARGYAGSETSIGKWLKDRNVRKEIFLISKCAHPDEFGKRVNEKAIREDFQKSQESLQTDYIDLYMLHRDDISVPVGEIVEIFNTLIREKKINAYGASNWTTDRIRAANDYAEKYGLQPITASSPNFSLAYQRQDPWGGGCVSITGKEQHTEREFYRLTQMPVFAYSALGRGFFSGRFYASEREKAREILDSVALKAYDFDENYERLARCEELAKELNVSVGQLALKWLFTRGLNVFAVVATIKEERIKQNIAALSIPLTKKQSDYLNLEVDIYE